MRRFLVLIAVLTLAALPADAQRAIEGAQPHPLVPLPPEGYITRDEFVDFAEIEFPAGPLIANEEQEILRETGAHTRQEFTIDGFEVAPLRLYRSYLQYFENEGFEILFSGIGDTLSARRSVDFIARNIFASAPSTSSEVAYILARNPEADHLVALAIYDRQRNRRIMVNVLQIDELETFDLFATPATAPEPEPEPDPEPAVDVVPSAVQDATALESGLVADGRVVVNAILFEFDRAEILPESAAALETVAGLMQERPDLTLLVVGHTDGVGSFDYNLRLSLDRASAVVAWLRDRHGITGDRLRPAGAGPMSPITTNRTETGRALNRRVELVEVID
ncbi:MAG: OmpA family protein [Rhodobacteraceae bacterium]|nr:OmpA family protein [Paracoccaceae bacterium]